MDRLNKDQVYGREFPEVDAFGHMEENKYDHNGQLLPEYQPLNEWQRRLRFEQLNAYIRQVNMEIKHVENLDKRKVKVSDKYKG